MMDDADMIEVVDLVRMADRPQLDRLMIEIRERAKVLHQQAAHDALASLKVGSRVEVQRIRPKYLCGAQGSVERIVGDTVHVRFDDIERRAIQRCGPVGKLPAGSLNILTRLGNDDDDTDLQVAAAEAASLALENRGRS